MSITSHSFSFLLRGSETFAPWWTSQFHQIPMGEYRHGRNPRYSKMRSILIINPNSTSQMTDGLKPLVDALQFKDVKQHHLPVFVAH
jgi:hypothetical protein